METLVVNEIYLSVQGESSWMGWPCVFVRLTACDLRCSYCDTAYAFREGTRRGLAEVLAEVERLARPFEGMTAPRGESRLPLVELTGGEPLLQPDALPFMSALCDARFTVLLETSGAHDIAPVDARVRRIMDLKCPSSGEVSRNRWENLRHLRGMDEVKFVIGTREDYEWARACVLDRGLAELCAVLFSWAQPLTASQQNPSLKPVPQGQSPLTRSELAERILADALPVRMQVQMHKILWPPDRRGV